MFLKALGGRLKPGMGLRWSGEVRYNGLTTDEFCVERAIGLVNQYDDHLPMLTVRETLVPGTPHSLRRARGPSAAPAVAVLHAESWLPEPLHSARGASSHASVALSTFKAPLHAGRHLDLAHMAPEAALRC